MTSVQINKHDVRVKEFNGERVVTFKDIDLVHERPDGTARRSFSRNKNRFIDGVDYFLLKRENAMDEFRPLEIPPKGITLITESGYLMLVKSFTDDLAWTVQRQLVNCYFRVKEMVKVEIVPQQELSIKERIKIMNIFATCAKHSLPYVIDLGKPFLSDDVIRLAKEQLEDEVNTLSRGCRNPNVPHNFSEMLIAAMNEQNLRQADVARMMGLDRAYIHKYVRGTAPSEKYFDKLCEILNIIID